MKTLKPSNNIVNFIAEFEGFRSHPYLCPAGVWTIGYGSTKGVTKNTPPITETRAKQLLKEDIEDHIKNLPELITVDLNQNQYDAIVSLVFNIGVTAFSKSTLRKLLNQGNYAAAADQFLRWNKAGGKVLPGLVRRRIAERQLFTS